MNHDWQKRLWQPVLHIPSLCTYVQLHDGTYSIDDLADMLEIINLQTACETHNTTHKDH